MKALCSENCLSIFDNASNVFLTENQEIKQASQTF